MAKRSIVGPLFLGIGLTAVTACGSISPVTSPATTKGFHTQQVVGGYGTAGYGYADPYGSYRLDAVPFSPYGFGCGTAPLTCGFGPVPVAGDIFGGLTFWTGRNGFDRQPASLPCGIAEENDVAFRPVGSAIWQPK